MLKQLLQSSKAYIILLILNLVITVGVFILFYNETGKDAPTYLGLAEGLLKGNYSYWNYQEYFIPDTLRNPGYPLFLAGFRLFTGSLLVIKLAQLILYIITIKLTLSVLDMLFNKIEIKNIFLLFLLPSIYIASYTPVIFPEVVVTFLIMLIIWIDLKLDHETPKKYLLLAILYGITFQVRPVVIFIPLIFMVTKFFTNRKHFRLTNYVILFVVFSLTMMPYAFWNKKNHGIFKLTSLEGGGGLLHLGYWMFKMPDYYDTRYWGNYCNREMISFINESDKPANIVRYNAEWDIIDSLCAPYLTTRDSTMLTLHNKRKNLLITYNGAYTHKREELMKEFAIKNISGDFVFYVKVKFYSAIRLWVTGLRMKDFEAATAFKKAYLLYPVVITLVTFVAAIIFVPWAFYRYRRYLSKMMFMLFITLYMGIIHIPFTIQSRYTIPVRLELLLLISVCVYLLFFSRSASSSSSPHYEHR